MDGVVEKSTHPARIVSTPGTCGGRPRLYGHRLDVDWYRDMRHQYGVQANSYILRQWPYLTESQVQCMSDFYDLQPEEFRRSHRHACPRTPDLQQEKVNAEQRR